MNSRAWSVDGIDPSVREKAEAAARRAGLSLNDWLIASLADAAPSNVVGSTTAAAATRPELRPQFSRDVADIHQRLDSITRQIDQISLGSRRDQPGRAPGVTRQLNDAISRLDARLAQITTPQDPRPELERDERQERTVEQVAAQLYRASPPLSPFDSAVAEIAARQRELEGEPLAPQDPPLPAGLSEAPGFHAKISEPSQEQENPPVPSPGPDLAQLERHLLKITNQIDGMQQPSGLDQSIAAFRLELTDIRHAILEAMPRQAIESIEGEVRSLARRIDDIRQHTDDTETLANIERALGDIHEVLRTLMPAEQLRGYEEAIHNLGAKLDTILRSSEDKATVQQLESAIAALRNIVSNVASNDALERLAEDVRLLSAKVDQITRGTAGSDSLASLEQRIAALTSALESRERERPPAPENAGQLEEALRALSDRIDRLQVGHDGAATFSHLEQRVSYLLERIEAVGAPPDGGIPTLSRVEDALHDILGHLERQHAAFMRFADARQPAADPQDGALGEMLRRELADFRSRQNETERQTQGSLEAVNSTLGHVVDRLAIIEGDLRTARTASPAPVAPSSPVVPARIMPEPLEQSAPRASTAGGPDLSNGEPAELRAVDSASTLPHFDAAPREFHAAMPPALVMPQPPLAISDILMPHTLAAHVAAAPELPPDHPLEPGTRPGARAATPSERIAASESAIADIPAAAPKPAASSSSFIAAARRAAQAAAAAQATPDRARANVVSLGADGKTNSKTGSAGVSSKIRTVLVAASVVAIVLGAFKLGMTLLNGAGQGSASPAAESAAEPPPGMQAPAANSAAPPPEQVTPQMTSPTPIGKQSFNGTTGGSDVAAASAAAPIPMSPPIAASTDVTGSISSIQQISGTHRLSIIPIPPTEKLPDQIGGPVLRSAALKGDPTAAYEVGLRFAEGKGVPTNYDEAAKWYDRAAQAGLIPAVFRLGTLYEKGLGVKKDADIARRYYSQAAERGNAKAMHNLAVLYADGGGNPDYKNAAQWFRKAADRGVADSQFNLGILYARGIGVDQNLAESFKWFSLAAAQGDADAGQKRDDIAKRLDAQSLAAARLAIQTFVAEPQPQDAVLVATPPGGWDPAPVPTAVKPASKPAAMKRASAPMPIVPR